MSSRLLGQQFVLHDQYCKPSDRLAGGESLLHAPCWNMSGRTSEGRGESILHAPALPLVSSFGEWSVSITCPVLESVSSINSWGRESYTPSTIICVVVCLEGSLYNTA